MNALTLSKSSLIEHTYTDPNGTSHAFVFREDGWFNMTKAAKAFGKDLSHFHRSPDTVAYLAALSAKSADKEFVYIQRGSGLLPQVGTWAHPKLSAAGAAGRLLRLMLALAGSAAGWMSGSRCGAKLALPALDQIIEDIPKGNVLAATPASRAALVASHCASGAQAAAEKAITALGYTYEATAGLPYEASEIHRKFLRGHLIEPRAGFTPRAPGRPPMAAPAGVPPETKGGSPGRTRWLARLGLGP